MNAHALTVKRPTIASICGAGVRCGLIPAASGHRVRPRPGTFRLRTRTEDSTMASKKPKDSARPRGERTRRLDEWARRMLEVERPPQQVLDELAEGLPDALALLEGDRATWARMARELADESAMRIGSFALKVRARALADAVRSCRLVLCSEWIDSGTEPKTRAALNALWLHAHALLCDERPDFAAAEQGLRAAAEVLEVQTASRGQWMRKTAAAAAAGVNLERLRQWCTRRRNPLPTKWEGGAELVNLADVIRERDAKDGAR